jgi:hypothetical protein
MLNVNKALAELQRMDVRSLKKKYEEVWREPPRSPNRVFLVKRIIWRMQALAEGSLSERALARARELANEADLRLTPPRAPKAPMGETVTMVVKPTGMPAVGTLLTRQYRDRMIKVLVQADHFEFEGERYKSLSAIARKVTGTQ